jgi:hypothetical protein
MVSPLLWASVARADDKDKPSAVRLAQAQFDQLKRLAGEWTGKGGHEVGDHEATVNYKVTAAGSTVMETVFAGTPHEMVTMYHLDGDAIVLTHYCALGNQPRMKSAPTGDPKRLVFQFLDGTNVDAAKDMHMHEATIELVADDHIRSAWTSYANGKPESTAKFDLKRKK